MVNFLVQTVFLTFLLLLFGEIFPKLVARGRTLAWVKGASGFLSLLFRLTAPLARVMVKIDRNRQPHSYKETGDHLDRRA